tara:strand:+ start:256 stop:729 length:474 start_codon:yes stop_codon:yes gene_type:complete
MKKYKDYFKDKIEEIPPWMSTIRKFKKRKAELEGEPGEEGSKDHQSTERLGDGEGGKLMSDAYQVVNESRLQYAFDVNFNEVARQVENLFKWLIDEANINGERIFHGVHFEASQHDNGPVILKILNINLANDPMFGRYVDLIEKTQSQLEREYGTST